MSRVPRQRPTGRQLAPQIEPIKVGETTPQPAHSQTPVVPESQSLAVTDSRTPAVPEPGNEPKYQQYLRKEARVRYDQAAALTSLRRKLNKRRHDRSEPLTDNTLIRLAVDLLLAHADELHGDTEDQLRSSLLTDSGSL